MCGVACEPALDALSSAASLYKSSTQNTLQIENKTQWENYSDNSAISYFLSKHSWPLCWVVELLAFRDTSFTLNTKMVSFILSSRYGCFKRERESMTLVKRQTPRARDTLANQPDNNCSSTASSSASLFPCNWISRCFSLLLQWFRWFGKTGTPSRNLLFWIFPSMGSWKCK